MWLHVVGLFHSKPPSNPWFLALPDNLRAHCWSYECSSTTCPGFDVLQGLLIQQSHLPEVYEALAALLLGKKTSHTGEEKVDNILPSESPSSSPPCLRSIMLRLQVCLDDFLQSLIDSQAASPAQQLRVEAAVILLELIKALITQVIMWKVHIFASHTTNCYQYYFLF